MSTWWDPEVSDYNGREKSVLLHTMLHNHPDGSILMQFNQRVNACIDQSHMYLG